MSYPVAESTWWVAKRDFGWLNVGLQASEASALVDLSASEASALEDHHASVASAL